MDKIRVYSIVRLSTSFALGTILPVYVLYFRHHQINLFQIALLAAIFEASILIFEMPTGIVADTYGRKISVILSAFVSLISGVFFIFFPFLFGFIIAEILNGLGETLRSGALEAWLVDSLKHEGKEEKIKYAFAQGTKYRIFGNLSGLILGGYLASLNMKLVWIPFTLAFSILCLFLILKMREDYKIAKTVSDRIFSKITDTIKKSLIVIKSQKLILALLVPALFSEFSFETISQYWQVHFSENLFIKTEYFGWILAISSVVTILLIDKVTKLSDRFGKLTTRKFKHEVSSLIILEVLSLLSLLVIALTFSPIFAILFFILLQSFAGFKEPIFLDLYNKHIPSEQRATLLSFQSLVGSGGEVLAGLCIGVVALKFGLRITFGLGTVALFFGITTFLLFVGKKQDR